MNKIESFSGQYRFLSNFFPTPVFFEGLHYPSVEHAFQAAKTLDNDLRIQVMSTSTAGEAKRIGRTLPIRSDWETIKIDIMLTLLREKFQNSILRQALLATGNAELIEGNWWGDTFWGVCRGQGENHLGKLLMEVRNE
jgi:ribA/ribD-fused uncharacterized protein